MLSVLFSYLCLEFSDWNVFVDLLDVAGVGRIFLGGDGLAKGGTAYEQEDQKQRSCNSHVQFCANGKEIKTQPNSLLAKVVGMAHAAPRSCDIEAKVVGIRKVFKFAVC